MDFYIFFLSGDWRVLNYLTVNTCIFAMYPSTEKMTNPATKLVTQLMVLRGEVR